MKKILNIAIPATFLTGLIIFWLIPALISAPQTYRRAYENTDVVPVFVNDTTRKTSSPKKVSFQEEKLPTLKKIEELEPEMFSRAIHYHSKEELDSLIEVYEVVEEKEVVLTADSAVEVAMEKVLVEKSEE